jgi:hypothetical protein
MDAMLAGGGLVARGAYFASKSAAPELRDRPCSTLVCVRASVYIKGPGLPTDRPALATRVLPFSPRYPLWPAAQPNN